MAGQRPEPFQRVLASLRERLRLGAVPPGARITATEVADGLGLSATPVREALSRLAGEGLLEDRRGQGFFVQPLAAADIADLYRLSLAHLLIAQDPHRPVLRRLAIPTAAADEPDPVAEVEQLFAAWVGETGSRALSAAFRRIQLQLGSVRRLEPLLIPDLSDEAAALVALADEAARPDRLSRLRQFHSRRLRLATRLSERLAQSGE